MVGFCTAALAIVGVVAAAGPQPADNPIFPADAKLEKLWQRSVPIKGGLTEGPAAAPDGTIYFTDILEGPDTQTMIQRFDPRTGKTTLFSDKGGKANGMTFDAQGRLLACDGADGGGRALERWNVASGERTVLADRYDGKRLNAPNDLTLSRQGRIYFTDPRYGGPEPLELTSFDVYLREPDGKLIRLIDDVNTPNGIVLSPDGRTLYVGDHPEKKPEAAKPKSKQAPAMRLYAYPLGEDGRVSGPRRTVVDFAPEDGCDGITVDSDGNVYLTCRSLAKPGIKVVDPAGKELAFFPTGPENQSRETKEHEGLPSNVEFGVGDDRHTLYVTIDTGFYRMPTKATRLPPAWAAEKK